MGVFGDGEQTDESKQEYGAATKIVKDANRFYGRLMFEVCLSHFFGGGGAGRAFLLEPLQSERLAGSAVKAA
jgi:hypothetical protein